MTVATLSYAPLKGCDFGRVVSGFDPAQQTPEVMAEIQDALYKHDVLVFPSTKLTPAQQAAMTKSFDPAAQSYGHGNNKTGKETKSILHPDLKTIPHQPEVQLIGHGQVPGEYEGLDRPKLKHPHHATFHATKVSDEDEAKGTTRFYRWHIDAALYKLSPPKVTTLYAVKVPKGPPQTLRYDDGSGDEIKVAPGATAFVSGTAMFEQLPPALQSFAVRTKVKYAPHPYVWMSGARARPTGLGLETEGREMPLDQLPEWKDEDVKTLPMLWKNPVTGRLALQVHPCAAMELHVAPKAGAELFPDGAAITDLAEVRAWLEKVQRPGIAPDKVYAVDWSEGDLVLFHNRGLLHSVTGAFGDNDLRMFHQCNLAASSDPVGPDADDVAKYA
ncbi:Clavaminate synthase-like protein [Cutaneotrichosporon oleaginosum]|uniref:Clavaminate synthase-like protein n=1 Tax=Cutaneotrichosporon oleaginosum TaxID=879819 RepID=A0A0J1AV31_9TREE|nr:Clavaminate synthase-like protein [Cutaneotrichosporon oleaginosum]KLT39154.1 Clavaminate synthase-like protein [Cutaneotrichosporon oleaginosum]TXT11337.1 hypothetical protein COLE_01747 [Cutaneotrichosporon oleaginosum]